MAAVQIVMPTTVRLMENACADLLGELRRIPLEDLKAIQAPLPYQKFVESLVAVRLVMGVE